MLSYRHAYHAGNHADLLKHYLLSRVLAYYNGKQKSYDYIDTHAGAGQYDLSGDYAQKTANTTAASPVSLPLPICPLRSPHGGMNCAPCCWRRTPIPAPP